VAVVAQVIVEFLGDFSLGLKRPGIEVDHSPPSSADLKIMDIYLHTPKRGVKLIMGK
jgi:hypothetical protein